MPTATSEEPGAKTLIVPPAHSTSGAVGKMPKLPPAQPWTQSYPPLSK